MRRDIGSQNKKNTQENTFELKNYHRTQMQKELVIQKLKERGCKITRQRMLLLDIILAEECSSCKEIHEKALKVDLEIGAATVYRMINTLEEIGAISRKNLFKIGYVLEDATNAACIIELDDNTIHHLTPQSWNIVIKTGLQACGYLSKQSVRTVTVRQHGKDDMV